MDKAIVLVSFGTSHEDARLNAIEPLREELQKKYPDYEHYLAYTSGMIREILKKRGIHVFGVDEILEKLKNYEKILLVPTHLIEGKEFRKVMDIVKHFENARLIKPVLSERIERVAAFLEEEFHPFLKSPDYSVLFMGHGSESEAKERYKQFEAAFDADDNVYVACVEGEPSLESVVERLRTQRIIILPLMYVAGEHVKTDLLGSGGWVERLREKGFLVYPLWMGLGEYPGFREIILEELDE